MIPYGRQYIDKRDLMKMAGVVESDWLTQGPQIAKFEKALARYCGAKYAVVVSNGTAALHLAYLASGLKKGDEVITTPNTFVATSNMLLIAGAHLIFCDIRLDNYNIDESKIESLITQKTKAIVPVHFAGHPCKMDKIAQIAKKHKLMVVEDACHALGASYKKSKIGNCKYSDMAVFSFHPVKPITTGEGGAIITNNKKYYEKLLLLRSHGVKKDEDGFNVMTELGYNYRLTDIQAALGESQLDKLNGFIKKRKKVAACYEKLLGNTKGIILPKESRNASSGWHIYVVRMKRKEDRLPLYKYLLKNGVGVNRHYPAVYSHPYYQKIGYDKIRLNNMDEYDDSCLTLPCYVQLKYLEIKYITDLIKKFFKDGNYQFGQR